MKILFIISVRKNETSNYQNNVGRIKYLINKARKAGFETDLTVEDFNVPDEEATTIFLSMREILKIHRYTNLTPREIEIKDYFTVGCLTALRYSDYSRLQPKNFIRNKIVIKTQKPILLCKYLFIQLSERS